MAGDFLAGAVMARPKEPRIPKPEAAPSDEGFLGRWSRRKAEAVAASDNVDLAASDSADVVEEETEGTSSSTGEPREAEVFDVSTLPDIDSLGPGSDFSMFMQAGVPSALKTKALRKLWRVKPELANLDGLLDYGEDLTGSFKVVDHLKTAYEVGRGFLKDQKQEDHEEDAGEDDLAASDASRLPESSDQAETDAETDEPGTAPRDNMSDEDLAKA